MIHNWKSFNESEFNSPYEEIDVSYSDIISTRTIVNRGFCDKIVSNIHKRYGKLFFIKFRDKSPVIENFDDMDNIDYITLIFNSKLDTIEFTIMSLSDDWYFVAIWKNGNVIKKYKCDDIEGVMYLIRSLKPMQSNFKAIDLTYASYVPDIINAESIDLSGYRSKYLGSELIVNGNVKLDRCHNLVSLPNKLHVAGSLSLKYCKNLKFLPEDLRVEGDLFLDNSKLKYMDKNIKDKVLGEIVF